MYNDSNLILEAFMHSEIIFRFSIFFFIILLSGCIAHTNNNTISNSNKITVAKVQKEIKIGMPTSEVVEVLGSPNIITTDSNRREVWVYDKIATEISYNNSSNGTWLLFFGASQNRQTSSSSQRTLTIIIKFDENSLVRDFAYRTSSF